MVAPALAVAAAGAIVGGGVAATVDDASEQGDGSRATQGILAALAHFSQRAIPFPTAYASFFGDILSKRGDQGYEEDANGIRVSKPC